jgi:excisionase family DNA binding protein
VKRAAELLTVSTDTIYDLFKRGELPGRKVGRKWLTTRNALLRWIESSSENNILAKAIERGDRHVITTALKSGKVQISKAFPIPVTRLLRLTEPRLPSCPYHFQGVLLGAQTLTPARSGQPVPLNLQ